MDNSILTKMAASESLNHSPIKLLQGAISDRVGVDNCKLQNFRPVVKKSV